MVVSNSVYVLEMKEYSSLDGHPLGKRVNRRNVNKCLSLSPKETCMTSKASARVLMVHLTFLYNHNPWLACTMYIIVTTQVSAQTGLDDIIFCKIQPPKPGGHQVSAKN